MDVQSFVIKQIELLELERLEEIEENRILRECTCLKYLQQKGVCIPKLHLASSRTGLYGRLIVTFEKYLGNQNLPSHCIVSGDIVGIAHVTTDGKHNIITSGVATEVKAESISIVLAKDVPESFTLEKGLHFFIIKLANDTTYKIIKGALKNLVQGKVRRYSKLVSVLFGNSAPTSCESTLFESMTFFSENLNESQKEAVRFALSQKEVALIHGPPGTGKTTTVVEIILQAVSQGLKVLVCAQSNVAVDNLVEKLSFSKKKMIRLGHPARFSPVLQCYALDALISQCDDSRVTADLRAEIDSLKSRIEQKDNFLQKKLQAQSRALRNELRKREKNITQGVLKNANIVLSTLTSANACNGPLKHLPEDHFDLVVIDECSQALEASCWIALLQAPKCVLAGDHHQLPPVIISEKAAEGGFSVTLMERLIKLHGKDIVKMLNLQYRMHQNIMEWPSQQLYENQLVADSSVCSHLLKDLPGIEDDENTSLPLLLIDTAGCDLVELETEDEESKGNEGEADLVSLHVESLIKSGMQAMDIGVITPYNLQVDLIKSRLFDKYPSLEVKSVDGFQGREKEAVVLSLVRSNEKGEVGFLSENRRINVAITRAKRHLVVICNSETVSHNPFLKSFIDYIERKGEVRSAAQYADEMQKMSNSNDFQLVTKKMLPSNARKNKGSQVKQNGKEQKLKASVQQTCLEKVYIEDKLPVSCEKDSRDMRFEEIRRILQKFLENSKESVHSFPSSLNSFERRIVHEIAEELGLVHISKGESSERYIIVKKADIGMQNLEIGSQSSSLILDSSREPICMSQALNDHKDKETNTHSKYEEETTDQAHSIQKEEICYQAHGEQQTKEKECSQCGEMIPSNNIDLHSIHCRKVSGSKGKKKKAKQQSKPMVPDTFEDEFDALVENAIKCNKLCSHVKCQVSTACISQVCQFCRAHFCFSHFLPEIHGCGAAAKAHARSQIKKTGKLYPGSGKPEKKSAPVKHAQLAKQLDKKIAELSKQRKAKPNN